MKTMALGSLPTRQPTSFSHSVTMHYKRKKYKFKKSKFLDKELLSYEYGRAIAKEVVSRKEFRKELLEKSFE